MLGGFLKSNGEWIEIPYYSHTAWARDECERLGIAGGADPVGVLMMRGYVQVSDGHAFLINRGIEFIKLTGRQLDFFLIHIQELSDSTRLDLVDGYDIVLPDVPASFKPTRSDVIQPNFELT